MPAKITERELRQDLALKINDKVPADHLGATGNAHGDATQTISGFMSRDDKTKLDNIAPGAQVNTVDTVAGRTGDVVLNKNDVGLNNLTNDAQVKKRISSTNNSVPTWNGTSGDSLNDGYPVETNLLGDSNSLARADAIKAYIDGLLAANDAMVFKGTIDCSTNPNYPTANAGQTWKVSVAGRIGGVNGSIVEIGDMIICIIDGTISGDHATVGSNFNIVQSNIDGAVIGPESAINNNFVYFDGATGKLIKDSGYNYSSFTPFSHIGTSGNQHGIVTDLVNGFMSNTDKIKLDLIQDNANNYTHPLNHPPSIISQDENNRFVTDTEKTTWNNKSNLALGETSITAHRGDRGKVAYDHSQAPHAPADAQKNSDITKTEIEVKLTGTITSHSHDPSTPSGHNETHFTGGSDAITPLNIGAEPSFSKNTAFNKNFGSTAGSVAEGNDSRFHSNANDPTTQEKQALAGTSGSPSNINRYVTSEDTRMNDARTPTAHTLEFHSNTSGFSNLDPLMNGAVTQGTSDRLTRQDHVHPSDTSRVPTIRNIVAGDGLSGGGDLSVDVTVTLGTPSSLTNATTNAVSAISHTHAITMSDTLHGTRGGGTQHSTVTTSVNGFMSSNDKTKLDGITDGAQANVGTNIAEGTRTETSVSIISSTGTGATLSAASTSLAGIMSSADKTKLDGIAANASNYTHPSDGGGSLSNLSGTSVINGITVNAAGHVTATTTRNMTTSDIGAEPSFTKNTAFNKNFGTTINTICQGDDSRLSDARTPTLHSHTATDLPSASTTEKGVVQLNDTVSSNSTTLAATANSVRLVNESIKTKIQATRNRVTLLAEGSTVVIGITGFDKLADALTVYQNSTYIAEDYEYSISTDSLNIVKDSGVWGTGTVFDFQVMKLI